METEGAPQPPGLSPGAPQSSICVVKRHLGTSGLSTCPISPFPHRTSIFTSSTGLQPQSKRALAAAPCPPRPTGDLAVRFLWAELNQDKTFTSFYAL